MAKAITCHLHMSTETPCGMCHGAAYLATYPDLRRLNDVSPEEWSASSKRHLAKQADEAVVACSGERGAGLKFDGGKPRWALLMGGMPKALAGVAAVLTFGAKKYAAHSWKKVENNKERYRDALYRHLNQLESGEAVDADSGLSHWDHVAANALFLSELSKGEV